MYRYKEKKPSKVKNSIILLTIMILVGVFSINLYKLYEGITVSPKGEEQTNTVAVRTSQTVENVKKQSKEVADMIEEVTSSVVGISKIKNAGNSIFLKDGTSQLGLGTGMIVSENGYILTNEHVSGAKYSNCYVTLDTGRTYNGNVVWSDSDIDLAIVKIGVKGLTYMNLGDSDNARVGEIVYAIGNPIGFEFQRTVTSGIISAKDRTIKIEEEQKSSYMEDLLQTDATINPGNSGGPLINTNGEVIGINSVKITSAEGIGFAVPINIVKPIIEKFTKTGIFNEASIGIFAYDKEVIPYLDSNLDLNTGIYVVQVSLDGPAGKSGLKEGDVITQIDSLKLEKMSELRNYIYTKNPEEEVKLTILRNNKTMEVTVKLGTKQ